MYDELRYVTFEMDECMTMMMVRRNAAWQQRQLEAAVTYNGP